MNNLSFFRHDEFIVWLIIFLMGRGEFIRPSVGYELRMPAECNDLVHPSLLALSLLTVVLAAPLTRAQDNYEIQVYGSDLVDPRRTRVKLHSNFRIDGSKAIVDGVYPTNHAEHETVEITHGFNDWFEGGFYIFTSITEDQSWQWVGDHMRPRVAVPQKWHWPVSVSISNEIGYQPRQYAVDTWTWEIRPIVNQKVGRWYWSLNPTLDRSFHGESVKPGVVSPPASGSATI